MPSVIDGVKVAGAETLSEVVEILNGTLDKGSIKTDLKTHFKQQNKYALDFAEVKGQDQVKRAMESCCRRGTSGQRKNHAVQTHSHHFTETDPG